MPTVAEVAAALERRYPLHLAEDWDRVGLVVGDPDAEVTGVLTTVDVTDAVIAEAMAVGADLIVAHHPLLLRGISTVRADQPKGRRVLALAGAGIACYAAHTNADSAPGGVCDALAARLGLVDLIALDARPEDLDKLVVFVPTEHLAPLVDAVAAAGAGSIGDYDRCYFASPGTGSFRPLAGADPYIGAVGEVEQVAEQRVELVLPRRARERVVAAMRSAHPYEEPAFDVIPLAGFPGGRPRGLGRAGRLGQPLAARDFAALVASRTPATVTGVRLAGDPGKLVERVAVLAGAGDSHLEAARAAGVDAYVTSDLRHHPVEEALAHAGAPVLVDLAHWAAESTWLPVLAGQLRDDFPGLEVTVSSVRTDQWTLRIDQGLGPKPG